MPDPYTSIAQADEELQARLADVLELRASDPQQRAMLDAYLSELQLPSGAIALDVGCGTGAVSRVLAERSCVREVVGIDPSPVFIEKARELRDLRWHSYEALPAASSFKRLLDEVIADPTGIFRG